MDTFVDTLVGVVIFTIQFCVGIAAWVFVPIVVSRIVRRWNLETPEWAIDGAVAVTMALLALLAWWLIPKAGQPPLAAYMIAFMGALTALLGVVTFLEERKLDRQQY